MDAEDKVNRLWWTSSCCPWRSTSHPLPPAQAPGGCFMDNIYWVPLPSLPVGFSQWEELVGHWQETRGREWCQLFAAWLSVRQVTLGWLLSSRHGLSEPLVVMIALSFASEAQGQWGLLPLETRGTIPILAASPISAHTFVNSSFIKPCWIPKSYNYYFHFTD